MKKLSRKEFCEIYQKVPRITISVVIRDKRGVLLIKRSIRPEIGKWHLPGGTIMYKEGITDAVKREAKEETGLQIKIKKFLGVFEICRKWKEPGYGHIIDLVFLAEPVRGKLKGNDKKAGEVLKFFKKVPKNTILYQKKILQGLIK